MLTTLASDTRAVVREIKQARRAARERVWELAGESSPGHGACATSPLVVDIHATLVIAHSEKENAAPTFKRTFGFHPLLAFLDHGPEGTGEPRFAIYRASHDDYEDSYLPTGLPVGTAEDALDTACGLYLGDPSAWT